MPTTRTNTEAQADGRLEARLELGEALLGVYSLDSKKLRKAAIRRMAEESARSARLLEGDVRNHHARAGLLYAILRLM